MKPHTLDSINIMTVKKKYAVPLVKIPSNSLIVNSFLPLSIPKQYYRKYKYQHGERVLLRLNIDQFSMGKWGARWKEMRFVEKIDDFRCYVTNPAGDSDWKYDYSLDYIRPFPNDSEFVFNNF